MQKILTKKMTSTKLAAGLLGVLALMAMTTGQANAACNPPPPISLTIPPLTFEGGIDGPVVGQPISNNWGATMTSPNFYAGTSCLVDKGIVLPKGFRPISGITYTEDGVTYGIYPTSIPNIGLIMGIKATSAPAYTPVTWPMIEFSPVPIPSNGMGINIQAKLIVIGPLTSGVYPIAEQLLIQVYGTAVVAGGGTSPLIAADLVLKPTTVTIKARTCKMTSAAIQNVGLPPVSKNQFSGVGSSAAVGRNFSLTTVCDAGVSLYATMTDANDPMNTSNTLSLGPGSMASGIGVQILRDNGLPISFGPDSSASGNTNQWFIGAANASNGEVFTIPLQARYVQTAQNMQVGNVRAKATVTFSYQ